MSIKVNLVMDEESMKKMEKRISALILRQIKMAKEEINYNTPPRNKLDSLIDLLIEKGIIERSDIT